MVERKAATYLLAKIHLERRLSDHNALEDLKSTNDHLVNEYETSMEAYARLEEQAKDCEKATAKANKDAQNAKGYADHTINSQKG